MHLMGLPGDHFVNIDKDAEFSNNALIFDSNSADFYYPVSVLGLPGHSQLLKF